MPSKSSREKVVNMVESEVRIKDNNSSHGKRNSLARISFSFPSLTSPTRKALLSNVTSTKSTNRRPETPPSVSKAMQAPPICANKFREMLPARESTIRTVLPSPGDKTQPLSPKEEKGIYSWSDSQLAQKYTFDKEVGFGNWGSCWLAETRITTEEMARGTKVAIKLVHRMGTAPSNARVKALWNEFKVLRSCGKPLHRNLVPFKEFIITPSYALVVMKFYQQSMNVALPVSTYAGSGGYFQQLLSAIHWLHSKSVTHCDIKVANLLVDTSNEGEKGHPILVDFGFATLHDANTNFKSKQSWGTPEYLSPERSRGDVHDERLSDMWALGVTFFEIATGRTPFEHDDEQFISKEQLEIYYNRTLSPKWVGSWSIPRALESLCRLMLRPEPKDRLLSGEALLHPLFSKPGECYEDTIVTRADEEDQIVNLDKHSEIISTPPVSSSARHLLPELSSSSQISPLGKSKNGISLSTAETAETKTSPHRIIVSPLREETRKDTVPEWDERRLCHNRLNDIFPWTESSKSIAMVDLSSNASDSLGEQPVQTWITDSSKNEEDEEQEGRGEEGSGYHVDIEKSNRPRPQTYHGPAYQTINLRDQTKSETLTQLVKKAVLYPSSSVFSGAEMTKEHSTLKSAIQLEKRSNFEDEEIKQRVRTIASTAQDLADDLKQMQEHEDISPGSSESSIVSQVHTEELAARLDEMGILAANLARMVEESKSKLSFLQESSASRSTTSIHRASRCHSAVRAPANSHARRESTNRIDLSGYSMSQTTPTTHTWQDALPPSTPSTAVKSKGRSLLKSGSLRRKVSMTARWPRSISTSSTVPFPSDRCVGEYSESSSQRANVSAVEQTPSKRCDQRIGSPKVDACEDTTCRSTLGRASSGRGRALSHFLTRYGSRNNRTTSVFKTSSDIDEDGTAKTSATLYDKVNSSEGVYGSQQSSKVKKSVAAPAKADSKHFFDDESVVDIGATDYGRQVPSLSPQQLHDYKSVKSPVKSQSQLNDQSHFTSVKDNSRHTSRVYPSSTMTGSSPLEGVCANQNIPGTPTNRSLDVCTAPTTGGRRTNGGHRERTISKMKSLTLGRSSSTLAHSRRDDKQTPRRSEAEKSKTKDLSTENGINIRCDKFETTLEQSDSRLLAGLTPLTPLIGEDPPRHHYRCRDSSSKSSHSQATYIPSTPSGGLWTRLFRGNANNNNTSSRVQSPRLQ